MIQNTPLIRKLAYCAQTVGMLAVLNRHEGGRDTPALEDIENVLHDALELLGVAAEQHAALADQHIEGAAP